MATFLDSISPTDRDATALFPRSQQGRLPDRFMFATTSLYTYGNKPRLIVAPPM